MATQSLGQQNFFQTTLSSAINNSDLTVSLDDVPTPSEGYLVIEPDSASNREIIYFTSTTASAVVCPASGGRGADDTTAKSHSSGATVEMRNVKAYWEDLQSGEALTDDAVTTAKIADKAATGEKLGTPVAFKASDPSEASGLTEGKITYSTEDYDLGGNFDETTGYFTAPYDGVYHFSVTYQMFNNSGSPRLIGSIRVNDSDVDVDMFGTGTATNHDPAISGSVTLDLTANDTVSFYAGEQDVDAGSPAGQFSGFLVGRTD